MLNVLIAAAALGLSVCLASFCSSSALAAGTVDAPSPDACTVAARSPLVVSVTDKGAKGDGKTDDTKAIQAAIDAVAGSGGTVYVPDGVFMVRGTGKRALRLRSKMTLKLADHAVLKVIPNGKEHYAALKIIGASDVNVIGGTIEGDRREHEGKAGEWGMGISMLKGASHVTISGVTAKEMWGDGFYIGDASDVALCRVNAIHNRRQGLSIIKGEHILVTRSTFRDTRGTPPSAGIDLEPDGPDETIANVAIEDSKLINNAGGGIMIVGKKGEIRKVRITGNLFQGGRPVLIKNAPRVRSTEICDNRAVDRQKPSSGGFDSHTEAVDVLILQSDCRGAPDTRFVTSRTSKKKKKVSDD